MINLPPPPLPPTPLLFHPPADSGQNLCWYSSAGPRYPMQYTWKFPLQLHSTCSSVFNYSPPQLLQPQALHQAGKATTVSNISTRLQYANWINFQLGFQYPSTPLLNKRTDLKPTRLQYASDPAKYICVLRTHLQPTIYFIASAVRKINQLFYTS